MALEVNNNNITSVIYHNNTCSKVYYEGHLILPDPGPEYDDYFWVKSNSQTTGKVTYVEKEIYDPFSHIPGSFKNTKKLYYSLDKITWTEMIKGTAVTFPVNTKCYLKGNDTYNFCQAPYGYQVYQCYISNGINVGSGCSVGGNVMSLFNFASTFLDEHNSAPLMCFFKNSTGLVSASSLVFPPYVIHDCYNQMFSGCSNLIDGPALPAPTLKTDCYQRMFYGCSKLTTIPYLPSSRYQYRCYERLFYGCSALKFSETQSTTYKNEFWLPKFKGPAAQTPFFSDMFMNTGGTYTSTPPKLGNKLLYTNATIIS